MLSFDVRIINGEILVGDKSTSIRFQNNIQSIFSRVRLMYGSTPIEDIIGYGNIVRAVTEWTGASTENTICQTSINEGIGGYVVGRSGCIGSDVTDTINQPSRQAGIPGLVNVRQAYIHGVSTHSTANTAGLSTNTATGMGFGVVPYGTQSLAAAIGTAPTNNDLIVNTNPIRRYTVQFALGVFNQPKLIPTKFMASQLAIEMTLANPSECMLATSASSTTATAGIAGVGTVITGLNYQLTNINLIPEILEFDASYDEMFLKGLMNGGVPIKFATWNNYKATGASTSVNIQIQERGRSVKSIFAMQRRDTPSLAYDTGATFFTTSTTGSTPNGASGALTQGANTLQEFQFRIGGR